MKPNDLSGLMPHFVTEVGKHNPQLASFLNSTETRRLLAAFYPARDSIQHRHPLHGVLYIPARHGGVVASGTQRVRVKQGKAYSLAVLGQQAATAIRNVDRNDRNDLFSEWGLLQNATREALVEPYKFVKTVLRTLLGFYERFFTVLNVSANPDLTEPIRQEASRIEDKRLADKPPFATPFLLSTASAPLPFKPHALTSAVRGTTPPLADKESTALYGIYSAVIHLE